MNRAWISNGLAAWRADTIGGWRLRGDHDLDPRSAPARDHEPSPARAHPAAVLIPVIDRSPQMTVLLTRRADHLSVHAGQISFPGGRMADGDSGAEETALRETEEEVGIAPHFVDVIGRLDRYLTRTGFDITPVVGLIETRFRLRLAPAEVSGVFEVPLPFLIDKTNYRRHERDFGRRRRTYYAITYEDQYIWGATAGMLMNLADVLGARM